MKEIDVAIIGAGIAGASLAWRLAAQRSVVLLERESQPGYHSTGRSAAMFMESYGPPAVRALTRASREFYERPPQGFCTGRLMAPRGVLYLATHEQESLMRKTHDELIEGCPGLQVLDADATLARVSCLRHKVVHGALFDPDAEDIDVHALHQGFLRGMRQRGGELRTGLSIEEAAFVQGAWELRLAHGDMLRAKTVVNAAGAWADDVARLFGAPAVDLVPHRRTAFTFKPPEALDVSGWPTVVGVDESYYFKPDAGQLLGSPANADPTFAHDVMPEELDVAMGIHQIEAVTTLHIRRPTNTWAGLRSFVRDGELVIGWDDLCPGFFWLAGQGGYGIQSAAGASELASALLCDQPLPESLAREGIDAQAMSPMRLR